MSNNLKVLLVGCGYMGKEYAKVLKSMDLSLLVIGNSNKGIQDFFASVGVKAYSGGLEANKELVKNFAPNYAIVATPITKLFDHTRQLVDLGVDNILVEKPGGISREELQDSISIAREQNKHIFVAYNRRFYSSVIKAKEIIASDGGLRSLTFEFTEWADKIADIDNPIQEKNNWLLANSSHVLDLAFYFGGYPTEIKSYIGGQGKLTWHPQASIFSGCGITDKNVLFSYSANWNGPGRWGIELITDKHRLILRPLEELKIQEKNSVIIQDFTLNDKLDKEYKPGLYKMVEAFLLGNAENLQSVKNQYDFMKVYKVISGCANE